MKQKEFDRILMDDLAAIPPAEHIVAAANPLDASITKILWGMVLTFFKLNFFYLNYILPLLGSILLYLGYRSLRKENRWFKLCWLISGVLLLWHAVFDVLAATPILAQFSRSAWNWPLTALTSAAHFTLLFSLRAGLRTAFAATGEKLPRDWLKAGIIAEALVYAIAVWCDLVPLTEVDAIFPVFGAQIIDGWAWLYHGRTITAIVLQIFLLFCIGKQGSALVGRGYCVTPAPVWLSAKAVIAGVFATVLLCLPPAMYLTNHVPMPETQIFDLTLTEHQEQTRQTLVELGLPEGLAGLLDGTELDACSDAIAVYEPIVLDTILLGQERYDQSNFATQAFAGQENRISAWMVVLPDQTIRVYQWFEYTRLPEVRLQEQFSVDPSGNYPQGDYAARLVWKQDGATYTCQPEIQIKGGQTADQLDEEALWWYENELERLGYLHYSLWIDFSIPKDAETMQGYTAYTSDIRRHFQQEAEFGSRFYDFFYYAIRHQTCFLQYPYGDLTDLGGHSGSYMNVPGESLYGVCQFQFDLPRSSLP